MTSTETEVAVLFADVVGSTRLYELLGDQRARELIQLCVEIMRDATGRNRGTVIKTIGDEILAIFPTVDDAVNAGGEMQQDIGARPELLVQGQHVSIRIGCHFGPVVLENKDIFGGSVHTANRMTSQAKAGQIILSADAVRRCSPEWRAVSRRVDVTSLRGLNEEMELYEVLWQQEDATSMLPSIAMGGMHGARRIRVRYLDREIVLDDTRNEITMGRAEETSVPFCTTLFSSARPIVISLRVSSSTISRSRCRTRIRRVPCMPPMAIEGSMLVASSCCQRTS